MERAKGKGPYKGSGKGKDKGKGKGKRVVKNQLSIQDRKVRLASLKKNSRCLRCGGSRVPRMPAFRARREDPMGDKTLPPGSDHVFTFGQHKGYTYHEVLQQYPGYYVWERNEPGTSRILNQFLDWVDMYYDVDHGTHQVTPKLAPEEVQPRPAPVPGSRHKTATKKLPNPPVEISDHVCKDFSLLGSNAYVMRKTCRDCGRVTQAPKNPTYTQDPETCNHAVTDKRGSTKSTSRTFCLLCGTHVDEMPRDEGQRREALGRAVSQSVCCTLGRSGRRPVEI